MRSARWALPVAAVTLALVLVGALAPAPALAHGGNPNYRSEINAFDPPLPGDVSIEVLDYDSYLQLLDQHGHEVVLDGYDGEPYARIEKDGTVQVNQRSPATYLNDSRFATDVTVPPSADPKAAAEWKTVDGSGTFIWHDHRMHLMSRSLPPVVKDTSEKTKVFDYEIPMTVDGKKTVLHGTLWWVGSAGTSKLPFVIAALVIVLGGGALVLWIRRRRGRDDGDAGSSGGPPQPAEPVGEAW
jgi:hypothetical protein